VPELGSPGSVRGALRNGCPYREHIDANGDDRAVPRSARVGIVAAAM
jgi:hypothetical protein